MWTFPLLRRSIVVVAINIHSCWQWHWMRVRSPNFALNHFLFNCSLTRQMGSAKFLSHLKVLTLSQQQLNQALTSAHVIFPSVYFLVISWGMCVVIGRDLLGQILFIYFFLKKAWRQSWEKVQDSSFLSICLSYYAVFSKNILPATDLSC